MKLKDAKTDEALAFSENALITCKNPAILNHNHNNNNYNNDNYVHLFMPSNDNNPSSPTSDEKYTIRINTFGAKVPRETVPQGLAHRPPACKQRGDT